MREDYDITVEAKAFLLRPDIPKEGAPRPPRPGEVADQLSEPLKSYAEEAQLIMKKPSMLPYTMYALEATEYAQQHGQFEAFHLAAYKAYWEEDKNLGDLEVIKEIALQCDLDWPDLSNCLESGSHRDTILTQHQEAVGLGIRGIPAFLIGNQLFTGAQPYDIFKLAMTRASLPS